MSQNHSQRAYYHIRNKLLDGSARPGSRLSYGPIGREIGVSATPALAKRLHAIDLAFHMAVIEASGNRRMLKVVGDSHILNRIFNADRLGFDVEILEATLTEHEAVVAAISARNPDAARDAMRRHIRNSLDLTLRDPDGDAIDRWWTR